MTDMNSITDTDRYELINIDLLNSKETYLDRQINGKIDRYKQSEVCK